MKKVAFAGVLLLVLGACAPDEEQKEKLKNALPPGCTAHDIGRYGEIDRLLIIECTGKTVTSSYMHRRTSNGKTTNVDNAAVFVIEG